MLCSDFTLLRTSFATDYNEVIHNYTVNTRKWCCCLKRKQVVVTVTRKSINIKDNYELYLPGSGIILFLFLDNTVDRWTNAAKTIALLSTLTSCSSWHNIHITTCLFSATLVCSGPKAVSFASEITGLEYSRNNSEQIIF